LKPLFETVKKELIDQINVLEHGDKLPSERTLSDTFGVDRVTVRRALSDLKKEGYIIKKQGAGNFVITNPQDFDINNTIALVISTTELTEHQEIIKGINEVLFEKNIFLQVLDCALSVKKENEYLDYVLNSEIKRVIVYPFYKDPLNQNYVKKLNEIINNGKKIIILDQYVPGVDAPFVLIDKFAMAYRMTEHAIALGHRDIVLLSTGRYDTTGISCKRGYLKALKDYNIPVNENLIFDISVKNSATPAYDKIMGLYENNIDFTALVSLQYSMIYGALRAFDELNVKVPLDVEVVFNSVSDDNLDSVSNAINPPCKPYLQEPFDEMGRVAANIFFDDDNSEIKRNLYYIAANFVN